MTSDQGPPIVPGYAPAAVPATETFPAADPPVGRRGAPVALVVVLAVLLVAVGGVAAWAVTHTGSAETGTPAAVPTSATILNLAGTLTLTVITPGWVEGKGCAGSGGFSDIRQGAQVVVTDPAGKTVAINSLSSGTVVSANLSCRFTFGLGVPAGLKFYGLAIGHRDARQIAEADLAAPLQLTVER